MNAKQHTLPVNSTFILSYGYRVEFRKWEFKTPGVDLLIACRGQETAHKVAKACAGAIKRCGHVDGLARATINRLTA